MTTSQAAALTGNKMDPHPLGSDAQILLTSIFGPYAQDDEFGSRKINPMELYHNQVTREQGPFSLRMFHRSFGLMLIQANLEAPCTLLDFPTRERFIEEITKHHYDVVGISGIMPNLLKVKTMCQLVREHAPHAKVVVGGHIANVPFLDRMIDADYIVKGDGVRWFRQYLGQPLETPINHPVSLSAFGTRTLGFNLKSDDKNTAAILLPSVGCPMGCNFCSTSHMFGGKGKFINFYETGDELFSIMCQIEEKLKVRSFFAMDENFLLHRQRVLRLLELMEEHKKSWALYVFSSARVIKTYTIDQLVRLGISWVWMGLEGKNSQYAKLTGIHTPDLIRELQSHGIRVLGSSIVGLETHTPENFDAVIDWAVSHDTDFHQFMLYTPIPGTPLYEEHKKKGDLLPQEELPYNDSHGQFRFNYRHRAIPPGKETELLRNAFRRDFEINGPSIARMIRTTLAGWKRYKAHVSERIRKRYEWEARSLAVTFAGAIWAMKKWYRKDRHMKEKLNGIFKDLRREFGWRTGILSRLIGGIEYAALKREAKRLAKGWTYEPPTICEKNERALKLLGLSQKQLRKLLIRRALCVRVKPIT
ncbi:MAG: B12-binding domain-containing radical SAM protein [Candidatus Omnitrophica bacterium CG11_big_fil_rev_8_21_14_0_20_45_26]|uniref:B12-binding domain-containing radical SAM protein n=1 Tax=Candidatus Abzuiibacterium crystallinum TaxID=1974748 RepID=A0A2H0LRC3_9BACT|nr:MAG: B12-binding domain-containing radical SAM protein [Candidatus Omnitrophica bacterium CG11_big_fil_rev_8_21_14_0_20_45_26]PIW64563.1 MAG: B12-binding domain-containing radical SAM protein [Candidatus Omnitrophica bacterium CG12_big_fil_rev_8_21_14_0_65_45_16]